MYKHYHLYVAPTSYIISRLRDVQVFLATAREIEGLVGSVPELARLYDDRLVHTRRLLGGMHEDKGVAKLVGRLQSLSLERWSIFRNSTGTLLTTLALLEECKHGLHEAIFEIARLEAYLACAMLMEDDGQERGFCYADFTMDSSATMHLEDFWNTSLLRDVAVPNTVCMGSEVYNTKIVTGSNASGKSTYLIGIGKLAVLVQAFGIGPAKKIMMSPFSNIMTYMAITGDVVAGMSLYTAEVQRIKQLLQVLDTCKGSNDKSLLIADELLTGTNPLDAMGAVYGVVELIGTYYRNNLTFVAVHFPEVTLLEERAKGFRNYQVVIRRTGPHTFERTYKVVPGRSCDRIALDILEKEGFPSAILKRAREIVAHPDQYKANFFTPGASLSEDE